MSTTLLERTRQYHEDVEVAEKVASKLLAERSKHKPKFAPIYDHAIMEMLLKIQEASRRVLDIYTDKDGLRADEIHILGGLKKYNEGQEKEALSCNKGDSQPMDESTVVWQNFYDQLKSIRDFHQAHTTPLCSGNPVVVSEPPKDIALLAAEAVERCNVLKLFSTQESFGRRVDMEKFFLEYTNLSKLRKHRENEFINAETARLRKKWNAKRSSEKNAKETPRTGDSLTRQVETTSSHSDVPSHPSITPEEEEELRNIVFQEIDYITFLKVFDDFQCIPRYCKYRTAEYETYLNHLLDYLTSFLRRINRLSNHPKLIYHLKVQFSNAWATRNIPGWEVPTHQFPYYSLPTDRLLTTETVFKSHCQGKKYKKALATLQQQPPEVQQKVVEQSELHDRSLAEKEFCIQRIKEILCTIFQRTIEHLQKKQSRTLRELELDNQEESDDENNGALVLVRQPTETKVESDSDDDDDGEKPVYNPLNLPLGWDGKPIPFWLYKLHGLGIEFKCEICGNYSYWGRRAFERHFQEWRHAFGMRCLKIPNTVHFKEITKIEDAILLYEQLKKEAELQTFRTDQDVECEDIEGNVMSARAFEDLQREGLV